MRLDQFTNPDFDRGRSKWVELCWLLISGLFFSSWLPGSGWRRFLLKSFGAKIGKNVIIKPRVRVKFPWRLEVGDFSWIGERVWIDNLAQVSIGAHCCISQGVYFCTGSHRWDRESFDLVVKPITIADHCWVGAMSTIGPGVILQDSCVLGMGFQATGEYQASRVYRDGKETIDRVLKQ